MSDIQEFSCIHEALKSWGRWRTKQGLRYFHQIDRVYSSPAYDTFFKTCDLCHNNLKPDRNERGREVEVAMVYDVVCGGWTRCPKCRGRGGQMVRYPVVDATTIRGRTATAVVPEAPPTFKAIDDAIQGFALDMRAVTLARYVNAVRASREIALRYANDVIRECSSGEAHIRISSRRFSYLLGRAKKRLAAVTGLPFKYLTDDKVEKVQESN